MRSKTTRVTGVFIILLLFIALPFSLANITRSKPATSQEKVMIIGGSVAYGWKDIKGEGYLHRAFQSYSRYTNQPYLYFNRAIVGANGHQLATMYKGRYTNWLTTIQPTIVVISWGLLNDALPKTSYSAFAMYLRQEIARALSYHTVVLVVSPPITRATYTQYPVQEVEYNKVEEQVVKSFHNQNVYYIDLLDQMKSYLAMHNQTYKPYEGDGWHPNTRGHILAGQLLAEDLIKLFGKGPITFSN